MGNKTELDLASLFNAICFNFHDWFVYYLSNALKFDTRYIKELIVLLPHNF